MMGSDNFSLPGPNKVFLRIVSPDGRQCLDVLALHGPINMESIRDPNYRSRIPEIERWRLRLNLDVKAWMYANPEDPMPSEDDLIAEKKQLNAGHPR